MNDKHLYELCSLLALLCLTNVTEKKKLFCLRMSKQLLFVEIHANPWEVHYKNASSVTLQMPVPRLKCSLWSDSLL